MLKVIVFFLLLVAMVGVMRLYAPFQCGITEDCTVLDEQLYQQERIVTVVWTIGAALSALLLLIIIVIEEQGAKNREYQKRLMQAQYKALVEALRG